MFSAETPAMKPMQTTPTAARVGTEDLVRRSHQEKKTVKGRTRPRAICCVRKQISRCAGEHETENVRRRTRQRIL